MARTAAQEDDRITKLERQLEAEYAKRAGRHVIGTWFWCFVCGKEKTHVVKDGGPHLRDGRCYPCQERRRRDREQAQYVKAHPNARLPAACPEEHARAAAQDALADEDLYAPAPGVEAALKKVPVVDVTKGGAS